MVVCRSNDRVSFILLPVVLVLVLLPAIAFASPPDPSWIPGIYDGADGDEFVNLVYDTSAVTTAASSYIGPLRSMPEILIERIAPRLLGRRFAQGPRAPPAADSNAFRLMASRSAPGPHTLHHTRSSRHSRVDPKIPTFVSLARWQARAMDAGRDRRRWISEQDARRDVKVRKARSSEHSEPIERKGT